VRKKEPLLIEQLPTILPAMPDDELATRNRALLLLGYVSLSAEQARSARRQGLVRNVRYRIDGIAPLAIPSIMPQLVPDEWPLLALHLCTCPWYRSSLDAVAHFWHNGGKLGSVHALDERTMLGTFAERLTRYHLQPVRFATMRHYALI